MNWIKMVFGMFVFLLFIECISANSVGTGMGVNNLVVSDCFVNQDCNDNNSLTYDVCINPSLFESYCEHQNISCFTDADCGKEKTFGKNFCKSNDLFQNSVMPTCVNPGTGQSYCSNFSVQILKKDCGDSYCTNYSAEYCKGNNWCGGTDINEDGSVNRFELKQIMNDMGKKKCTVKNSWCDGSDLNKDSKVNQADLLKVLVNFGKKDCAKNELYKYRKCYTNGCSFAKCYTKTVTEEILSNNCGTNCSKCSN